VAASGTYVHGYSETEAERLSDQARTLTDLLHHDTAYPPESKVLEAGCGVGAQTITLARRSPGARITSVDISRESVEQARAMAEREGLTNVAFDVVDIFDAPFEAGAFDHVFVCFVLEHLPEPVEALKRLRTFIRPGGTLTAIEGDHGSFYCSPETGKARRTVQCLINAQAAMGGDSLIGRRLYPLLSAAGFADVRVSPRMVYVDSSKPELVDGFSKKTFIAMVEGVRDHALNSGMMDEAAWDEGIRDLYRATESDGTFCYTFFKAVGCV
jgi:SAM-dependent methyltransferase